MERHANSNSLEKDSYQLDLSRAQDAVLKKDFVAAESFFRHALLQKSNSTRALAGVGQCLCQLNRPDEGIPFLRQAGKQLLKEAKKTGATKLILDLAYQLTHWHAPAEALILAKAVLSIDANSASAHHTASISLQALNRHAEAYAYASRTVELAPHESNAIIQLAVLEAKLGKPAVARQRLESLVAKPFDPNIARAHLELGVILDKLSEFDSAFDHLTEAGKINMNTLMARGIDKQAVFRDINQFKSAFDAQFLQSASSRLPEDDLPSPVFLIGFYRSGTTLAEQILASHPQVISSDEAHLLPPVLSELYKITNSSTSLPERLKSLGGSEITHLRQYYWQNAKRLFGQDVAQKVLLDKTTLNILNIELINTLFPNAAVIFALRDPRDICLSCFMQSFTLSSLTANFLSWNDCARFYALIMDYWVSIRDNLSLQWMELRYEDVINDIEGQFRPIFNKIGLEWSVECSEFYRHSQGKVIKTPSFDQVTRPLYNSSVDRWRHYEKHFATILPVLKPYIESFGYHL